MSDRIQSNLNNNATGLQRPKVAIIDNFKDKSVFIDNDKEPDIAHGNVVKRFIEEGLPDAEIKCFDISKAKDSKNKDSTESINNSLVKILKNIENGEKYDAINLSHSSNIPFSAFSRNLNKGIFPDNVDKNTDEIKSWLYSVEMDEAGNQIKEVVKNLDKITAKGIPVYISAGNEYPNMFNLYTLADNAKSVGSLDENKEKSTFSADNSRITHWEKGEFEIKKITDKAGNEGFDFTADGTVDIKADETTTFFKTSIGKLQGTSYATPKALVRDLNGQD